MLLASMRIFQASHLFVVFVGSDQRPDSSTGGPYWFSCPSRGFFVFLYSKRNGRIDDCSPIAGIRTVAATCLLRYGLTRRLVLLPTAVEHIQLCTDLFGLPVSFVQFALRHANGTDGADPV